MTLSDLEAGLAACAKATPLPWVDGGDWMRSDGPFPPDFPEYEIDERGHAHPAMTRDSLCEDKEFLAVATAQYPALLRFAQRVREAAENAALSPDDIDASYEKYDARRR
jgi:hypothetical protein